MYCDIPGLVDERISHVKIALRVGVFEWVTYSVLGMSRILRRSGAR